MTAINNLGTRAPTSGSQFPFNDPAQGQDARCSLQDMALVLAPLLTVSGGYITQYSAPNASAFTVTVSPPVDGTSVFLLLTPAAGYAAGTITLPPQTNCIDGQELLCTCTQAVTALTVAGNSATVNGAPTTLTANAFFRLRFDGVFRAWYRVG